MGPVLITGAGGFLGWHMMQSSQKPASVYGIYRQRKPASTEITPLQQDLTRFHQLESLIREVRPSAIVHAAALSDPNYCEQHPEASRAINYESSLMLAKACRKAGITFLFTSTDLVFNGKQAPYREGDLTAAVMTYGKHKAEAESAILQHHPGAMICRLPLLFGLPDPAGKGMIKGMATRLKEKKELKLFTDEYRTPANAARIADFIWRLIEQPVPGILHLGGPERISRFEFGQLVATTWQLDPQSIWASKQEEVNMPAARPADVSLDSRKALALGYHHQALHEELRTIRELMN